MITPIEAIRAPYTALEKVPIQSCYLNQVGEVELFREYKEGLEDLEGVSHTVILYLFHESERYSLRVKPFLGNQTRGVFATRAPARPNPIGLSNVRLVRVEGTRLHIKDLDVVDGTPLLDIKPYVPDFDIADSPKIGWYKSSLAKLHETKDDGRFSRQ